MQKNSLMSNYTGTGSKRSKKYYSDTDAGKYYFKPNHDEFYGEGYKKPNKNKSSNIDRTLTDECVDLDIIYVSGAASIRKGISKNIAHALGQDVLLLQNYEGIIQDELFPEKYDDTVIDEIVGYDNKGDNNFNEDPFHKKPKNLSPKNSKKYANYRPWQEFQQTGPHNTMN